MNAQNDLAWIKIIGVLVAVVVASYVIYTVYSTLTGFTGWGKTVITNIKKSVSETIDTATEYVDKKIESAKEILTGDGTAANPPLLSETSAMQAADEGGYIMYQ
jgi:hypothetical protein